MNRWMQVAYNEALSGMLADEGGPFGAAVVKEGKLIATAHNEVLLNNDPTAHAEITAIRRASVKLGRFDLSDCTLYVTCHPCPMCLGAIFWAHIPRVYYGATKEDAERGGFDDRRFYEQLTHEAPALRMEQIDAEANAALFEQWLKKENRHSY